MPRSRPTPTPSQLPRSPGLAGGCGGLPGGVDLPAPCAGALGHRHAAVVFGAVIQNRPCRRGASWGCRQETPSRPPAGPPRRAAPSAPLPCSPACLALRATPSALTLPALTLPVPYRASWRPGRAFQGPRGPASPSGQKQPKVQKPEQLGCGLEQVRTQGSPHSRYTWLAGHSPTAVGPQPPRERRRWHGAPHPPQPWPRTRAGPPAPQVSSASWSRGHLGCRVCGLALPPTLPGLTAEAGAPPGPDGLAGHAALAGVLGQRGAAAVVPAWLGARGHVCLAAQQERLLGHVAHGGHQGQQPGAGLGLGTGPLASSLSLGAKARARTTPVTRKAGGGGCWLVAWTPPG